MKKIELSKGKHALVDAEDFERVNAFKWYASNESKGCKHYAIRRITVEGRRFKIRMHRFIMQLGTGFDDSRVVDHLQGICKLGHVHTGCGLDNRKCGLEIITQAENMRRSPRWRKAKALEGVPCL